MTLLVWLEAPRVFSTKPLNKFACTSYTTMTMKMAQSPPIYPKADLLRGRAPSWSASLFLSTFGDESCWFSIGRERCIKPTILHLIQFLTTSKPQPWITTALLNRRENQTASYMSSHASVWGYVMVWWVRLVLYVTNYLDWEPYRLRVVLVLCW